MGDRDQISGGEKAIAPPASSEFEKYVLDQLQRGERRMNEMQAEMNENTKLTKQTHSDTAAIVTAFQAASGAFKVLEFVGKVAKPLLWILGGMFALGYLWSEFRIRFHI